MITEPAKIVKLADKDEHVLLVMAKCSSRPPRSAARVIVREMKLALDRWFRENYP